MGLFLSERSTVEFWAVSGRLPLLAAADDRCAAADGSGL